MLPPRATVLVLVPGRSTLSFQLDGRLPAAAAFALCTAMLMGVGARRCLDTRSLSSVLSVREVTGSLHALRVSERAPEPSPSRTLTRAASRELVPVPSAQSAPSAPSTPPAAPVAEPLHTASRSKLPLDADAPTAWLRLNALHFGEVLRVKPFDDNGLPDAHSFEALRHLMRCRITGEEVPIEPRLVRILAQLSAIYNRPIQLVSGHRKPFVIGTKPTSQHALGRAADIRIAGVSIEELRSVAIRLGARGVGLYPEKGFVHVDVREKPKYFWTYSEDEGEEADGRPAQASRSALRQVANND
jgi:uncharacterized protein YcbK (DUF882 family)